jgi:hypothetical protein
VEFLLDPATGLRNMGEMLRPGGWLFMQFPNYDDCESPTCYKRRETLEGQLRAAGFVGWEIYALHLSPWAQRLFHWLHEIPVRQYRARRLTQQQRSQHLHSYDETWAFHNGRRLEAFKVPIHIYWAAVMMLMRVGGDIFHRAECGNEIVGKNLFVAARKGENGSVNE